MAENVAIDLTIDDENEGLMQLVGFMIGAEKFGVNILMVQEIIRSAPVTAVPNSPVFVEGVINLRGDIIPVIDLRKRLNLFKEGMSNDHNRNWILILTINNHVVGFIVDRVTEVLKVPDESIEPPPEIIVAGLDNQYIQGVCDIDDTLVIVLNFDNVLFSEEYHALKETDVDEVSLTKESVL